MIFHADGTSVRGLKLTKIAVTSRSFARNATLREELLALYPDVTFVEETQKLKGDQLIDFLSGHDRAITALDILDKALFERLPELKVVSKYGVGVDSIDLDAMAAAGVRLGWSGGHNKRSVSELVISMAIQLLRHLPKATAAMIEGKSGSGRQHVGRQLSGRTVGIIGCGYVGKDLAILLRAMGCEVLANDIKDLADFYDAHGIKAVGLDELIQRADIVTLHVPHNETTDNLMSAERLSLMRPDAILINCARGGLVDEQALKTMLMDGRLAGAALDVFNKKKPDDEALLSLPNFIPTPHLGGSAIEAIMAMGRAAIRGLEDNQLPERGVFPDNY